MRLILDEVSHEFTAGRPLFAPVSGSFASGETIAVTGPSGAGKSTLLAIVAGLIEPTHGTVQADGLRRACWVTQNPHGVAARTALDHVVLPLIAQGARRLDAERRARVILARFGLEAVENQRFGTLSGGQAQRLMLARAVAAAPNLLLVDEPTAQLDRSTAVDVDAALGTLAESELLVIIATHSEDTRSACSRVLDLQCWEPSA